MGVKSIKLRYSARGQPCSLRFSCCNYDPETTVLAHLPSTVKGMGNKSDDWHAVFACSDCHDKLDRQRWNVDGWLVVLAIQQTQKVWRDLGLIIIAGDVEKAPKVSKKALPPVRMYMPGIAEEDND